jgi:hypothetical protein
MKYYKLDRDTKAYLKRMALNGIKTPPDIYSVNDFIVGLKDLSLYSSVEEMWLLRSSQNAGTGSIVYAFKNNIYNGTISGPTWTFNGTFFSISSEINMPNYKLKTSPFSLHVIDNTNFAGFTTNGIEVGHLLSSNDRRFFFPGGNREYLAYRSSDGAQFNLGSQITSNNFKSTLFSLKSSTSFEGYFDTTYKSGGTNSSFDWDKDGTTSEIFRYRFTSGPNPNPTTSSIVIFNENITSKYLNYYNLYKTTIGKGLGLA